MSVLVSKSVRVWVLAAVTIAIASGHVSAAKRPFSRKLDSALAGVAGKGGHRTRVIVRLREGRSTSVRDALRRAKSDIKYDHASISSVTADLRADSLEAIADLDDVESVSIDAPVQAVATPIPATAGAALRRTLGITANMNVDGRNVGVAVIDSGISPLPEFGRRIRAFYDFTRGGIATRPYDDYGHGTHVAGLIGGGLASNSDTSEVGIASKVSLIGMKVLDAKGSGYTSDVIRAIEFAIANRYALDIDIINLSLGHVPYESAKTDPLVRAVDKASAAGIVVVVAAGNVGISPATGQPAYGGILSPGNARSAITVGAAHTMGTRTRGDDVIGPYSSRGPTWGDGYAKPDLVAPGHKLLAPVDGDSELPKRNPSLKSGSPSGPTFLSLTGTSMAAAVTSGVVALILEANADSSPTMESALTPNAVKTILQYTSLSMRDSLGNAYNRMTQGAGALNADGALQLARAIEVGSRGRFRLAYGVGPVSYIAAVVAVRDLGQQPRLGRQRASVRVHLGRERDLGR
jgi:serine protease AprX